MENSSPGLRFSVVTVCFNSAATIADTVRSVAGQDYPDIEHIIIDGASTDDTLEILRSEGSRIATLISEPDRGIYDAMNKGLRAATGHVIGFLNSDDVFSSPSSVRWMAEALRRSGADACYGDVVYVDRVDTERTVRYWRSAPFRGGEFRRGWQPAHPTFYVKREVFDQHGHFDLSFRLQADFELAMRFLEVGGVRSCYVPRVLVKMRTGGASNASMRNVLRGNLEAYRACRKHGLSVSPWFIARKIMSRLPQFFLRPPRSGADPGRQFEDN